MKVNKCGDTKLKLSELGLGCWAFGGGDYWGTVEQLKVNEIVNLAIDHGINYFDTAEVYNEGRSEISLGKALEDHSRDSILIGSKISPINMYPNVLRKHCEGSLKRLQTDYVDIYMVHWPIKPHSIRHYTTDEDLIEHPPSVEAAYDILKKMKQEGKIREIGVSNFSVEKLEEADSFSLDVAVNQLPYNLYSRAIEFEVLPYCRENGVGIVGYMTLLQALLTGKYDSIEEMPAQHRRTRHFNQKKNKLIRHGEPGVEDEINSAHQKIKKLANSNNFSMSELAIKYVTQRKGVTSALVGSTNPKHLLTNIKAVGKKLDNRIFNELDEITKPIKDKLGPSLDYFEATEDDRTI